MEFCRHSFSSKKALISLVNHNAELCVDYRNNEAWVYYKERERDIPYEMAYDLCFMMFHNKHVFELDSGNAHDGREYFRFNTDVVKIAKELDHVNHLVIALRNCVYKYDSSNVSVSKKDFMA